MTHDLAASGLRFGIEEEFFLLDASDLDIVRSAPAGFVAACRDTLGEHFAEEMFECQVEVASPVFSTLAEAARFHGQARQRLAHLAMDFGLRSLCVGTHPFADWRRARSNPAAHFARLFEDQGRVARRSLVCGLHVHVEIPPSHDRMAVLQRVLPWLPLLLALSASSPFRGGRRSGLASYRRALCGEWPRMNIPPALPDEDAYRRHLALLRETGCIREDGQVWWMIRPSSHVPTLELRICDACPRLADALSLAGLFRALVGEALGADPRALPVARDACLEENYWQALRYGCAGRYLVEGRCVGAGDWLEMAWRQCRPQARATNGPTSMPAGYSKRPPPVASCGATRHCAQRARNGTWRCAGWWKNCWRRISSRPWPVRPASAPTKAAGHSVRPLERRCQSAVRSRENVTGGSPP